MPASRPPPGSFEALLTDPYVVACINRRLTQYGFRAGGTPDLEDARQETHTRALVWAGERPKTRDGVARLCVCIAHRVGASYYRSLKRGEAQGHAGLTGAEPDEVPLPTDLLFDTIDLKRLIAVVAATVPDHLKDAFEDIIHGAPQAETFRKYGINPKKGAKLWDKWQTRTGKALLAGSLGALFVAGYFIFFRGASVEPGGPGAQGTPSAPPSQVVADTHPSAAPSSTDAPPPTPEQLAQAVALRQKAWADADAGAWDKALQDLAEAERLDEKGGRAWPYPELMDHAEDMREAKTIPRTPWKPPPRPSGSTSHGSPPR